MSTSLHTHTPSLTAFDPRGLAVRNVNYHRRTVRDAPEARIQRQVYGNTGLLIEQWDPRLFSRQRSGVDTRASQRTAYSLGGQVLRTDSVDAGWKLTWLGEAGQVLEYWDARGAYRRLEHDRMLRPLAVFEQSGNESALRCVERLSYAPASADNARLRRCGRLVRHDDPAGTLLYDAYDVQGEVLRQTRRFHPQWLSLDWPLVEAQRDTLLEAESFVTAWRHGALGQRLEQVDAKGNRQQWAFGVEGQLKASAVVLASGERHELLAQCTYDASGRVITERAANGVIAEASYGVSDDRLHTRSVYRSGRQGAPLQALRYDYDAVGNVARIADAAQPVQWGHNTRVEAVSEYAYDTLYQLTRATGRESTAASMGPALPATELFGAVDDSRWRHYVQHYSYDPGGNLQTLRHVPSRGAGYTRRMHVAAASNHAVLHTQGGAEPGLGLGFDAGGNPLELARGQAMAWNVRGQLERLTQVVRSDGDDDEVYGYDAGGQRVFKRRRARSRAHTHWEEVRYLPGLEIRRNTATGEHMNVLLASAGPTAVRILQWEQGRPEGIATTQVRWSVTDTLGSCALEFDAEAQLISHEIFYPFGGTAWWAARNAVEAMYKLIRYSGKERDGSGLYYYGFRYYAPWLQRWISPDPAGASDGLNLYRMVGNNPLTYVDSDGLQGRPAMAAIAISLVILGTVLGSLMDQEVAGAWAGFVVGVLLFASVGPPQPMHRPGATLASDAEFGEILKTNARAIAAHYRLGPQETALFLDYAYEQRHAPSGVSFLITSGGAGRQFAHAGPTARRPQAVEIVMRHRNPTPELARIGYSTRLLRDETRAQVQAQVGAAASEFEVNAAGRAAGSRRVRGEINLQAPPRERQAATSMETRLTIDATQIESIHPATAEGRSIAQTLSHLGEGRFSAVHWHKHQDELWSADLHGYPGSKGRGTYRLMLEHRGGSHYRVLGVRNPHRR